MLHKIANLTSHSVTSSTHTLQFPVTSAYSYSLWELTKNYNLYNNALSYYNITYSQVIGSNDSA
jgi:hypothetical protein